MTSSVCQSSRTSVESLTTCGGGKFYPSNGAEEISSELTKQEAQEMLDTVSETLEKLKESADTTEELSKAILEVQIAKARVAALNLLSN